MNKSQKRRRAAMSTTELLGCLIAVAGGVWIGATYMGVSLNDAAFVALDEADLLETVPEDWRPDDPDAGAEATESKRIAMENLAVERAAIREKIAQIRIEAGLDASPFQSDEATLGVHPTRLYWSRLKSLIDDVLKLQSEADLLAEAGQHVQALDIRQRALSYGQRGIELISEEGVDRVAIESGRRLSEWYAHTADFHIDSHEHATKLAAGQMTTGEKSDWQHVETQYAMQTDLVRRKLDEALVTLRGMYPEDFDTIVPFRFSTNP